MVKKKKKENGLDKCIFYFIKHASLKQSCPLYGIFVTQRNSAGVAPKDI